MDARYEPRRQQVDRQLDREVDRDEQGDLGEWYPELALEGDEQQRHEVVDDRLDDIRDEAGDECRPIRESHSSPDAGRAIRPRSLP